MVQEYSSTHSLLRGIQLELTIVGGGPERLGRATGKVETGVSSRKYRIGGKIRQIQSRSSLDREEDR